jgi:hypothetical protein
MQHMSAQNRTTGRITRFMRQFQAEARDPARGVARLTVAGWIANSWRMHTISRRALFLPLLLTACGGWEHVDQPPRPVKPLRYDHLTKLLLNVGLVDTEVEFVPGGPGSGDVSAYAPEPPVAALRQMARDRLEAAGNKGRAAFIIRYASLIKNGNAYDGNIDVALDIFGPDNNRAGHVEARA